MSIFLPCFATESKLILLGFYLNGMIYTYYYYHYLGSKIGPIVKYQVITPNYNAW